jgi:hypothetical protein
VTAICFGLASHTDRAPAGEVLASWSTLSAGRFWLRRQSGTGLATHDPQSAEVRLRQQVEVLLSRGYGVDDHLIAGVEDDNDRLEQAFVVVEAKAELTPGCLVIG